MPRCTALETLLGRVFDDLRKESWADLPPGEYKQLREDFIFHMTDWKDDLEQLRYLFNTPDTHDEETTTRLVGILYHIVPHLNAAVRLLLDEVPDPFATPNECRGQKPEGV